MTQLLAGFGRTDITPKLGCQLVGYGGRDEGATGVHDPLFARALVLEDEGGCYAIVSNELCYVSAETVTAIRRATQQRIGIEPERVFITTTHTHAGPHDRHANNWVRSLAELTTDAIESAFNARQPARIGSGSGFLYGYSINRRWLDRPVDPGIGVLRVDNAKGNILGLLSIFGCHSVVMGYDNLQISGDWPGYASTKLEAMLGNDAVCLFLQGGAGDINPLVASVRQRLRAGHTISAIGDISYYYGSRDDPQRWSIGDRGGGTFDEVAELGDAYAAEVLYTAQQVTTSTPAQPLWTEQVIVNAAADPDEHASQPQMSLVTERPDIIDSDNIPAEIMLMGIGDLVLVGQPGEVFAETAVRLKVDLRALGYQTPALVSYANGFILYLPEPGAFDEGGYEPNWAVSLGISRQFQPRFRQAIAPILQRRSKNLERLS